MPGNFRYVFITFLSDIVKQYPSLQMVTDCQYLPRETCSPERVQPKEITRPVIKKVIYIIYILADSGFFKSFLYQGGVKSTVFWVFEHLKFKISEGYAQNWCFPDSAQLAGSV